MAAIINEVIEWKVAAQDVALTVDEAMEWSGDMADDLDVATTTDLGGAKASDFGMAMAWSGVVAIILDAAMAINFGAIME